MGYSLEGQPNGVGLFWLVSAGLCCHAPSPGATGAPQTAASCRAKSGQQPKQWPVTDPARRPDYKLVLDDGSWCSVLLREKGAVTSLECTALTAAREHPYLQSPMFRPSMSRTTNMTITLCVKDRGPPTKHSNTISLAAPLCIIDSQRVASAASACLYLNVVVVNVSSPVHLYGTYISAVSHVSQECVLQRQQLLGQRADSAFAVMTFLSHAEAQRFFVLSQLQVAALMITIAHSTEV